MNEVRLYIAVPSSRDWKMAFGASLTALVYRLSKRGLDDRKLADFYLNVSNGASCLPRTRQKIINEAIKGGYTHLLMLDDDMSFPDTVLKNLIRHDLACVGANYRQKTGEVKGTATSLYGEKINSSGKVGLQEVMFAGLGIMLVDLKKIEAVKAPHFEIPWVEEFQDYLSEDSFFCNKLRENGIPVYIDHEVSVEVSHVGDIAFKFEDQSYRMKPIKPSDVQEIYGLRKTA